MRKKYRQFHLWALVAVAAVGGLIYTSSLDNDFVFDDFSAIVENPRVRAEELSLDALVTAAGSKVPGNRPVAYVSFALNHYLGGYEVRGYHVFNIAIHVLNAMLVYWLALLTLRRVAGRVESDHEARLVALFAALLFVAHPLQVQAVTYVVQRMTSMAVLFYLLALVMYVQGRSSTVRWRRWTLWVAGVLSWCLALGTKQIAITLPLVVVAYEWYFFEDLSPAWARRNLKQLLLVVLGFVALLLAYVGPSDIVETFEQAYGRRQFTLVERVLTEFRVLIAYIGLVVYPHPSRLNLDHGIETSHSLLDPPTTLLSLLVILSLMGFAVWVARRDRLVSFCVVWFFVHHGIESTVWPLEMMFEHRMYLPMVGVSMLVSYAVVEGLRPRRRLSTLLLLGMVVALGVGTYVRNRDWRDGFTLWSDVIAKNPNSARAYNNAGVSLKNRDDYAEAIRYYQSAIDIQPRYAQAWINLAVALGLTGESDAAIEALRQALTQAPNPKEAHRAHKLLGQALFEAEHYAASIEHLQQALSMPEDAIELRFILGQAYEQLGDADQALEAYRLVLQGDPEHADAMVQSAVLLSDLGQTDVAVSYLRTAIRIAPEPATHFHLASLLTRQGALDAAIEQLHEALRLEPAYAEAHNGLGVTFAMQGNVRKALEHFEQAVELDPSYVDAQQNRARALDFLQSAGSDESSDGTVSQ